MHISREKKNDRVVKHYIGERLRNKKFMQGTIKNFMIYVITLYILQ